VKPGRSIVTVTWYLQKGSSRGSWGIVVGERSVVGRAVRAGGVGVDGSTRPQDAGTGAFAQVIGAGLGG